MAKDYSANYLLARSAGNMAAAVRWRKREWETDEMRNIAETEERTWWLRNKPKEYRMAMHVHGVAEAMRQTAANDRPGPAPNPKAAQAAADGKTPLDYLEPVANEAIAYALKSGADKYGRRNYADPNTSMLMSTYVGAFMRHVTALQRGEWFDPESGWPHVAHIGANVHVVMAAREAGTMRYDTRDTHVTKRSDAVHVEHDQSAKGADWGKALNRPSKLPANQRVVR